MNIDEFLIGLISRERRLSPAMDSLEEFDVDEELAELSIQDLILDFIGVPPDTTATLSQEELCRGECKHGVEYYCRDWVGRWFEGDVDSLEKYPTAKDLLEALREEAAKIDKDSFRCPKCEAMIKASEEICFPPTSHMAADFRD